MAVVVSDTSLLIHLSGLGHLALLRALYQQVLIPSAVWRETVEEGRGRAGEVEVREAVRSGWVEVRPVANGPLVQLLKEGLDDGEAEAIALALEATADLVLLDETQAREKAALMGLPLTGTIGVLIRAKREGLVETLRPLLDQLRQESFWISESLYRRALEAVGENN